jgi:hypothetical protein
MKRLELKGKEIKFEGTFGIKRDRRRIARICKKLQMFWRYKETNNQRLGQLIGNISTSMGVGDPYYFEDDVLEDYLDDRIRAIKMQIKKNRVIKENVKKGKLLVKLVKKVSRYEEESCSTQS